MIFLLPIEIKDREIFSKVFLTYKLLEKGHKVIIGSQRDIPQNISKISNCFWFDKNTFLLFTNAVYEGLIGISPLVEISSSSSHLQ